MSDLLLGVDLGTSSVKTVLFSPDGSVAGTGRADYDVDSPRPGWAEQSPEVWWNSTVAAVRGALKEAGSCRVRGVGLSGQMHGLVCLDKKFQLLRPAIIWADRRSGGEAAQINSLLDAQQLYGRTLNRVSSGFLFPSLLWVMRNEPEIARAIAFVVFPKDYIRFRLTGKISTELSDACGSGSFDVVKGEWLNEILFRYSVNPNIMPYVQCSEVHAGEVLGSAAEALGIEAGIPVAAGAGDQAAQAVGNGLIHSGQASSNIGTAGQFFIASDNALHDPELRCNCFNHAQIGMWYLLGANLGAGFCLQWLWRGLLGRQDYDEASRLAASVPAGSRGLLFHPYLNGDRTPHQDPEASASFVGLSGAHGAPEMVRSVMEGVVFSMREGLEIARSLGLAPSVIVASGGGARSALWRQIQADVYNLPVVTTGAKEQACAGAAIFGGVVGGVFRSIAEGCEKMVCPEEDIVEPIPENVRLYDDIFNTAWRGFYTNNRQLYPRLSRWRGIE